MKKQLLLTMSLLLLGVGGGNRAFATDLTVGSTVTDGGYTYTTKSTNMITNGSFESGFTGWTNSNDYSTEITSSKFTLTTDGAQDGDYYLVGTTNSGSSSDGSLGTAWEIEDGKTYYFCYWIKNLDGTTDTQYLKTSLTNTPGTETSEFEEPSSVSADWQQVEYVFTNDDSYKYIQVKFRWLENHWGFDDFQLYEIEEVDNDVDDDEFEIGDTYTEGGYTYNVKSDNMFVNGGFNSGMDGWTAGGYTTAAVESNFTIHTNGGYNDGHYLVAASAGTSNEKTPSQAIKVEEDKTYLFIGYTSGKTPDSGNLRYSALFEMSDATTEVSHTESDNKSYGTEVVRLDWGASSGSTTTEWTKTTYTFTATTPYVGMRMGWSSGSYDGFQLYEIEEASYVEIIDKDYEKDETVEVNGVTWTVKTGENLFTNGGFNSGVEGWTAGGYTTAAEESNFTIHTGGGYNDGAYLVTNSAGASSEKTPSQAINVEVGKTYLFVGYTNGTAPSSGNLRYNALFEMNDEGTAELNHVEGSDTYSNEIIRLNWGNGTDWEKTEGVFTATTGYVGMRMGWSSGSYDGFQIYEVEAVALTEDTETPSTENPMDMTGFITNPDASQGASCGWVGSGSITTSKGQHWSGDEDRQYFEPDHWSSTGIFEESIYQNITLPYDGVYKLTAAGRSTDYTRTTLFAGDMEYTFPNNGGEGGTIDVNGNTVEATSPTSIMPLADGDDGSLANDGKGYGWNWGSVEIVATAGSLKIGAMFDETLSSAEHKWASITDFKLEYLGDGLEAVKEALSTDITDAKAIDVTTNVGTEAFMRPQTAADALTTAIEAAETALAAIEATEESITAAIAALQEAVETFHTDITVLNKPTEGQTFAIVMNEEGFTYDGKAVNFVYDNSNSDWRCYFDADRNRNYAPQHFTFTPDASVTNGYTLSTVAEGGTTYYLNLASGNLGIRATTEATSAYVFQVVGTDLEGVWHLYNSAAGLYVGSNGDHGLYTSNTHDDLQLVSNEIPVNITEAGWTTLVLPYDAELPSTDLKAYTIAGQSTSQEDAVTLTEVENGKLTAKQPYLINGTDVKEYAINGTSTIFDLSTEAKDDYLVGTWTDISSVTQGNYVLQYQSEASGTAFYIVNSDSISLAANRCYLLGTSVSTANAPYFSLSMGDNVATAIESALEAAQSEGNEAIYDLSGRKVSKAQKGIYIKGGKKVIIK